MHRIRILAGLAAAVAIAACGDDGRQELALAPETSARVKFFNFGVNTPGVNFYANDAKVTGVSSTSCTPLPTPPADSLCQSVGVETATGVGQGGAAAGGFYVGMPAGQYTLTGRIAATTDRNLAIASVPLAVADGKAYSFYISGIYTTTAKQPDAFAIDDNFPTDPSPDSTYIRFVHAIPNAGPLTLSITNPTTGAAVGNIATAVAYKSGSRFLAFPLPRTFSTTLNVVVRNAGGTTNLFERTAISILPRRVYTLTARGDITVSATGTSANRPQIDVTANR